MSQLSTYECVYNDVCTVMDKEDSSKIAYYCKYNGRVKAGIDFSKVDIAVKERQEDGLLLITVTLPEVTLGEPEVDITIFEVYVYGRFENADAITPFQERHMMPVFRI
ncbi:MAG: DUF4230 domain-containing protein [Roseburia faecis]